MFELVPDMNLVKRYVYIYIYLFMFMTIYLQFILCIFNGD